VSFPKKGYVLILRIFKFNIQVW